MKDIMRELTIHKTNPLNTALTITASDLVGAGGSSVAYEIRQPVHYPNPEETNGTDSITSIRFQEGAITLGADGQVIGANGITAEALLAVLEDKFKGMQAGQFACRENAIVLTKIQECLMWLDWRTRDRMNRGVEGTHQK